MKIDRIRVSFYLVVVFILFVSLSFKHFIKAPAEEPGMILIPGGEFELGLDRITRSKLINQNRMQRKKIEAFFKVASKVNCMPFYIDKNEVTNRQYLGFMKAKNYKVKSKTFDLNEALKYPNHPVNNIGWEDAIAFAKSFGKRLPTEEEWEKAAKGSKSSLWPWGNEHNGNNYNGYSQGYLHPVDVGLFPAGKNDYGLMDMAGNVYEMTSGRWFNAPCMKGGSYLNNSYYTMCAFRWAPGDTINGAAWLGFRCVKDVNEK